MSVIESITGVFTSMFNWLISAFSQIIPIFWNAESGLTFYGTLMVIALSISLFFLVLGIFQRWLHLRS